MLISARYAYIVRNHAPVVGLMNVTMNMLVESIMRDLPNITESTYTLNSEYFTYATTHTHARARTHNHKHTHTYTHMPLALTCFALLYCFIQTTKFLQESQ